MNKDFNLNESGDFESAPTFMLYDEQLGKEAEYVLLARTVVKEKLYYALAPLSDSESYVILEVKEDGEDIIFEAVEDDALFEELALTFDELFAEELDYDND